MTHRSKILVLIGLLSTGCLRNGQPRAEADETIGRADVGGVSFTVTDGLAHVRSAAPGELVLWASAPIFTLTAASESTATREWMITVHNCMPDAVLSGPDIDPGAIVDLGGDGPVTRQWQVSLPASGATTTLAFAPPDADDASPWRFAIMGDIQTAMPTVHEVFERINQEPGLRFVVSTGDVTENGEIAEYDLLELQLQTLDIPFYSTIGNHELNGPHERWTERFGRFNLHFTFKGVTFSIIDSGSASLDPQVYQWLDTWLEDARDDVHVFATHFPLIDPIGIREGAFRSRSEASQLLTRLSETRVDMTVYGHIHSFYEYTNAGIPAYISGGGGAWPERLDGIDRHFLRIDASGEAIEQVTVVRVD